MNLQDLQSSRSPNAARKRRMLDPSLGSHLPQHAPSHVQDPTLTPAPGSHSQRPAPVMPAVRERRELPSEDGGLNHIIDSMKDLHSSHSTQAAPLRAFAQQLSEGGADALDQLLHSFAACEPRHHSNSRVPPYVRASPRTEDFSGTMFSTSEMVCKRKEM